MTILFKDGVEVKDCWTVISKDAALLTGVQSIIDLDRFLAMQTGNSEDEKEASRGVTIEPDQNIEALAPYLGKVDLIRLVFPNFGDGRAYTAARKLRERYGYTGEIRATGDVLLDQVALMERCGFDAFEVVDEPTIRHLRAGFKDPVALAYQPSVSERFHARKIQPLTHNQQKRAS